ncbi:MAG TPA: hypothetical protein RMG48_01195 [Myxococcales bacterium LLY-WYZ-16_1]|nr:hypothetical protein [Myxococcales bacterium LLY-WYZ-16_1]
MTAEPEVRLCPRESIAHSEHEQRYIDLALERTRKGIFVGTWAGAIIFGSSLGSMILVTRDHVSFAWIYLSLLGFVAVLGGLVITTTLRAARSVRVAGQVHLYGPYTRRIVGPSRARRLIRCIDGHEVRLPPCWHRVMQEGRRYRIRGTRIHIHWDGLGRLFSSDRLPILVLQLEDLQAADAITQGLERAPRLPLAHGVLSVVAFFVGLASLSHCLSRSDVVGWKAAVFNLDGGIPYDKLEGEHVPAHRLVIDVPVFEHAPRTIVPRDLGTRRMQAREMIEQRYRIVSELLDDLRYTRKPNLDRFETTFSEHQAWDDLRRNAASSWRPATKRLLTEDLLVMRKRIQKTLGQTSSVPSETRRPSEAPRVEVYHRVYRPLLLQELKRCAQRTTLSGLITEDGDLVPVGASTLHAFALALGCGLVVLAFLPRLLVYDTSIRRIMARAMRGSRLIG